MSLPPIIIFQRNWDTIPSLLVQSLLSPLSKKGYQTLCIECPCDLSADAMRNQVESVIETKSKIQQEMKKFLGAAGIRENVSDIGFNKLCDLINMRFPDIDCMETAIDIKEFPVYSLLKEILDIAKRLSISVKGVDVDSHETKSDDSTEISATNIQQDVRIKCMVENLLELRKRQEEGIIFVCGVLHAQRLITELKKNNQDKLLYYFPHSEKRWDEGLDDMQLHMNPILRNHTHLLSEKEVVQFKKRVIEEVASTIKYRKEVGNENSHFQFLSNLFKVNVRLFCRPGFHLDALIDSDNAKEVRSSLEAIDIQTHDIALDGQKYLVIPNVNSAEIADRLRKIAS
ncbi:MAG: hypothetical protein QRY74_04145 [Chlamydia sp.]